jgi:hypothetical protein
MRPPRIAQLAAIDVLETSLMTDNIAVIRELALRSLVVKPAMRPRKIASTRACHVRS